jgi:radical SAM protein with 4Fe4S-binding SPASM domain
MVNYKELKKRLLSDAYNNNIPIVGEFELLGNCNFNCSMCYAKTSDNSLSTEEWKSIFKQAYDNGMIYALLTGGEVFLRPDFLILYNYLFDMGVKITIYTNGSKLTDEILDLLQKKKPEMIAITLYGYDKDSYKLFTGIDAFLDVDKNIDKIKNAKLPLALRTIPMPLIYKNIDLIIDYAKSKGLTLGYFLYVSKPRADVERLSTAELLDFERKMRKENSGKKDLSNPRYCGAFKNGFFINHKGYMQGCSLMPIPTKKVGLDFKEVFQELRKAWGDLLSKSPCSTCDVNKSCFTCLAKRYLEGNMFACGEYLRDYAEGVLDE